MNFKIREMQEEDWSNVRKIYQSGINSNLATFETHCPTYTDWDKAHSKDCRFVVTDDEIVIGWAVLSAVSNRSVFEGVAEISIYMDDRYQNEGVGTMLLNHLVHESEKCGFWLLESVIFQNNPASLALHKKCGFREVGYREKMGKDRFGDWRNVVVMEKRSRSSLYN